MTRLLSSRGALPRRASSLVIACSLAVLGVLVGPVHAATTGAVQTYLVIYRAGASSQDAAAQLQGAGGALVYNYQEIGVAVARSNRSDFASNLQGASNIDSVVASAGGATRVRDQEPDANASDTGTTTVSQGGGGGALAGLQWDMKQIHADQAHAITGGSPSVVVGDIDTGLDFTHPDLAPNVDFADSVSCVGGVPNQAPSAWNDDNGHGTHTAGTIAAAGLVGVSGVAPSVRIAAIKAGDAAGFFFPESVVCAFMWAGTHHINVTNNSYFADPFLFNCKNDPVQFAIWKAEDRAIRFAMQKGTVVVAAETNQADDLAHPTQDSTSPDNVPTPTIRPVTNACVIVPVEIPGVIGVTADGNLQLKSFYSSYGAGMVQVIAPGGDSILQRTAAAPNGRVLSTWPASLAADCSRKVVVSGAVYCYLQGTSMASPHVAGVAALIESMGTTSPGAVQARINSTADPLACPADLSIYAFFPAVDNGAPQVCTGGIGYNSFNGHGQVNALAAVS
jgi:lantibiotic leader peptide-processing serine protease